MFDTTISGRAGHPVDPHNGEPCVMGGTVPPGVTVPLHSHADPETFIQISGEIEGLSQSPEGFVWVSIRPGDIFHVPGGAKHLSKPVGRSGSHESRQHVTDRPVLPRSRQADHRGKQAFGSSLSR
ncbi:cupin domain-containing protein [Mesorhizobium sp. M9A.F.Ca.ET.002.03.1.2]|uniref:cupin domain-containing protein n=1 Tax=Mesorhizobium sp. M9A.F.Ca.ET.002.03.1.2 TaxID=2493668 RepID=UPI000F7603A5|nr:cupin domain-containing protein [Mesorhizobium sp. M9A.F.Ca.ET.002.03.1.2]AZN99804.1 cupin domain-containing protein [Mesorhizobium sp. M9A.F.Ca.ET.002.03.1.2]